VPGNDASPRPPLWWWEPFARAALKSWPLPPEPGTSGIEGAVVSDETVLRRATADRQETQARIQKLHAEIERQEAHVADVDKFLATYHRYASGEGQADEAQQPPSD
jgi:hypothetical protein